MVKDYKTLISSKPLRVRFDKVSGFIRIYEGSRYLVSFSVLKNMISFTIGLDIKYYLLVIILKVVFYFIFSQYYTKIKVDFYDSLPLEKTLTSHNVIILIKSIFNKDRSK